METEQPSAQAQDQETQNEGIQTRINELTAKFRSAEEENKRLQQALIEEASKRAEQAMQFSRQPVQAPQAPVDPLAQFKDQLDPVVAQAVAAATEATRKQMEAHFAPMIAQQAAQMAGMQVAAEAAAIPGLPTEVTKRAAQLASNWRAQGLNFPPSDALNFALGEYQRGQLQKAQPVLGYDPRAAQPPAVTAGYAPPPAAPRALPGNFELLSRAQQNDLLEKSGALDAPF